MPVRHFRTDPRKEDQRRADKVVLQRFEHGEFLAVEPAVEREAMEQVERRHQERGPALKETR